MPNQQATRRSAIAMGFTALGCSTAPLVLGKVPDLSGDAELIRCCERIVKLETELDLFFSTIETVDDEERAQPEIERLDEILDKARAAVEEQLPAQTMEGARAVARAALATGRTPSDEWFADHDFVQLLGVSLIEFIADSSQP